MSNHATRIIRRFLSICAMRKWFLLLCLPLAVAYCSFSYLERMYGEHRYQETSLFEYGWPVPYTHRLSAWPPKGTRGNPWPMYEGVEDFSGATLAFDLAFAVVGTLAVMLVWHRHCDRRRPWQFSLTELLVTTLLVAVGLNVFLRQQADFNRASDDVIELQKMGWIVAPVDDALPWYFRPLRDVGITDEEDWVLQYLAWMPRYQTGKTSNINDVLAEISSRRLRFVRCANIEDSNLTDEGLTQLCDIIPKCTSLYLCSARPGVESMNVTDRGVAYLTERLPHLRRLWLEGAQITDDGVQSIATMQELGDLKLDDAQGTTTVASLGGLLELPRIGRLIVPRCWKLDETVRQHAARRGVELQSGLY